MPSVLLLQRDPEASPRLAALIAGSPRFTVMGTLHTVSEARALLARRRPDVLLTDLRLRDGGVQGLLDELHQRTGERPHVLATMMARDDAALLEALRAGADAYWLHTDAPERLIDTLRQVWRGESTITPSIAKRILAHFDRAVLRRTAGAKALSDEERDILTWLARGFLIDEIAAQGHASVHSIARGVRQAVNKLQDERLAPLQLPQA